MASCIECGSKIGIFKLLIIFVFNRAKCSSCGTILAQDTAKMKLFLFMLVFLGTLLGFSYSQTNDVNILILIALILVSAFIFFVFNAKLKKLNAKRT